MKRVLLLLFCLISLIGNAQSIDSTQLDTTLIDSLSAVDTLVPVVVEKDTVVYPSFWPASATNIFEVKQVAKYNNYNDTYFSVLLVVILLSFAGIGFNREYFGKAIQGIISVRYNEEFYRDYQKRFSWGIFLIDWAWAGIFGLMVSQANLKYNLVHYDISDSWIIIGSAIGVWLIYGFKRLLMNTLGMITGLKEEVGFYLFNLYNYFRIVTPLLVLMALILPYFDFSSVIKDLTKEEIFIPIMWISVSFWAFSFVIRFIRVAGYFTSSGLTVFLRFVFYFCTFEILPTITLVKLSQQ